MRSKWGTYGIFEHGIAEVPADYRDEIGFFELPAAAHAAHLLFDFECSEQELKPPEIERRRTTIGMADRKI